MELILLTLHSLGVYSTLLSPDVAVVIATALVMGAIVYRSWQQPDNWALYGLGWGLEILTIEALSFGGHSTINLAIANIALGIMTQLLGEVWRWRHRSGTLTSSSHVLPLLYGVLSVVLRWNTLTSWTGFCSFGVAMIAIGVGRRRQEFKPLVYLGIIGISVGIIIVKWSN